MKMRMKITVKYKKKKQRWLYGIDVRRRPPTTTHLSAKIQQARTMMHTYYSIYGIAAMPFGALNAAHELVVCIDGIRPPVLEEARRVLLGSTRPLYDLMLCFIQESNEFLGFRTDESVVRITKMDVDMSAIYFQYHHFNEEVCNDVRRQLANDCYKLYLNTKISPDRARFLYLFELRISGRVAFCRPVHVVCGEEMGYSMFPSQDVDFALRSLNGADGCKRKNDAT